MNAVQIAQAMVAALQQVRHYGADHAAARQATAEAYRALAPELDQGSVRIGIDQRTVTVQAAPLPLEDRAGAQLHTHLAARRIGTLTIDQGTGEDAVAGLIRLLAREPEELIAEGGLEEALQTAGISGIWVHPPGAPADLSVSPAQDPYAAAALTVSEIMTAAERGEPVDVPRARLTVEGLAAVLNVERGRLWRDVADRGHDELDPAHAVNTCLLTLFAGEALDLPPQVLADLGVAALLHDVGLAALPWEQRLQERTAVGPRPEWRHPAEGAFLLRHLGGRESVPMVVAAEHHMLALGQSPVLPHTRLVALADYLDATSCGRVPAMRQASMGGVTEQLLRGVGPGFDTIHVHILAGLLHQQQGAGVEFTAAV